MHIYSLKGEGEEQAGNNTREMPIAGVAISVDNVLGSHSPSKNSN